MKLAVALFAGSVVFFLPLTPLADNIPGTTSPVGGLTEGLAWEFIFEKQEEEGATRTNAHHAQDVWRFKSEKPVSESPAGKSYLRFRLKVLHFDHKDKAIRGFVALKEKGARNTGLNYEWNRLYLKGEKIYYLTVPCLFSEQNFNMIAANLENAVNRLQDGKGVRTIHCGCGGPCKEVVIE